MLGNLATEGTEDTKKKMHWICAYGVPPRLRVPTHAEIPINHFIFLRVLRALRGWIPLHSRKENIFDRTVRRYSAGGTVMVRVKTRAKWPWSW